MRLVSPLIALLALTLACSPSKDDDTATQPGPTDDTATDDTAADDTGVQDNDLDDDGYDADVDCDDSDPAVNPGATEDCGTAADDDCDGDTNDVDATGCTVFYADVDADGFGGDDSACLCEPDATYALDAATDCDDANNTVNPDATETCDGVDNNCDGTVDEDSASDASTWYPDADGDGYGADSGSTTACTQPTGFTDNTDDCDDSAADTWPGATEVWYDGQDQDCAGGDDYDADGDGYTSSDYSSGSADDCDDTDSAIHPGATDTPQDGTDQDCDGSDAPYTLSDLSSGELIITEVMWNPDAVDDTKGEWFELYNNAGGTVDINGLYVYDDGTNAFTVTSSVTVADGDWVVLGNNIDSSTNGGATVDFQYSTTSFQFSNSGGDELSVAADSSLSTVFDSIAWDGGTVWPSTRGASLNLDTDHQDADSNDFGGHWCASDTSFGDGDQGTPGAANESCGYTYTYDADISPILSASCAGCHTGGGSSGGLSMSWDNLVEAPASDPTYDQVAPFDSASSYIYMKIMGTAAGAQMPKSGSISSADVTIIQTWIDEGAAE